MAELIHPLSIISPKALIGPGVEIGPFSIIHDNVILKGGVRVGAYCELGVATALGDGSPLIIGEDSLLRSHAIFYESSTFGKELITGHNVVVREMTRVGEGCQLGTLTEIQGQCVIGNHTKLQSSVFVGQKTLIGDFVRLSPHVILTNDPTPPSNVLLGCEICDFASLAARCMILPGVKVGEHSLVAAQALVTKDVPAHHAVAGVPARIVGETRSIKLRDGSGMPAYPWTTHFRRGFPPEITRHWPQSEDQPDA